uniref:Uncharacterized protein n=1 Tax=Anguilla anguilla TaxID=7936 RepID=A0A0E9WAS3_ANGAN
MEPGLCALQKSETGGPNRCCHRAPLEWTSMALIEGMRQSFLCSFLVVFDCLPSAPLSSGRSPVFSSGK